MPKGLQRSVFVSYRDSQRITLHCICCKHQIVGILSRESAPIHFAIIAANQTRKARELLHFALSIIETNFLLNLQSKLFESMPSW